MSADFSYEKIQPLVAAADVWGSQVSCTFRCPTTGATAQATANMESLAGKIAGSAFESAKQNIWWGVRNAISSAIWKSAGSGILGRAANDAAYTAMGSVNVAGGAKQYSEKDRQEAIVAAFKSVAGSFRWDEAGGRWMGAGAVPAPVQQTPDDDFTRQLQSYPVSERYDQGILARLLVAMAGADQQVAPEERAFLASFLDPAMGSLDDLMSRPAPSKVEVEEVSSGGVRETILMLCQGMALSDENLDAGEVGRLRALAAVMGIAAERAEELMRSAQTHVLNQAIRQWASSGALEHGEVIAAGQRLGLSAEDTERVLVQYRKRAGMF